MSIRPLYYDRDGRPMALEEWAEAFEDHGKKHVAKTELPNGFWISTVWLGIDYSWGGGKPLIFETMVFSDNSFVDLDMERYSTEKEALEGHARMVEKWKTKGPAQE